MDVGSGDLLTNSTSSFCPEKTQGRSVFSAYIYPMGIVFRMRVEASSSPRDVIA